MTWLVLAKLSSWIRILTLIAITEWGVVPEAMPMGLQTICNRRATGWWTEEQIIRAYHGLQAEPEADEETWALATQYAVQYATAEGDPDGYLFALSAKDMLGREVLTDSLKICNGHWCVTFTKEFPEESTDD